MAAVASHPSTRQTVGSFRSPTIFECDAAIITATMMGTEITALTTADQYKALIGFSPDALMPRPRSSRRRE